MVAQRQTEQGQQQQLCVVECPWCHNTDLVANPAQKFCSNRNHRIYYSKRRSKELLRFWISYRWVFSNFTENEKAARLSYDKSAAEKAVKELRFAYDDYKRRFTFNY